MAKQKNGSTEAVKNGSEGQKLGCRLSSDASALLGALEYTLRGSTGDVTTRAYVALVDSLPRRQADGVEAMMKVHGASLNRLRKACGATVQETAPDAGAGQGASTGSDMLAERLANVMDKAVDQPISAALASIYGAG